MPTPTGERDVFGGLFRVSSQLRESGRIDEELAVAALAFCFPLPSHRLCLQELLDDLIACRDQRVLVSDDPSLLSGFCSVAGAYRGLLHWLVHQMRCRQGKGTGCPDRA